MYDEESKRCFKADACLEIHRILFIIDKNNYRSIDIHSINLT